MADTNKEFSKRLLRLIKENGLNQSNFSEKIGISSASATKYCKNGGVPEWNILLKIAKFFDVSIEWLLTGKDGEEAPKAKPEPIRKAEEILKSARAADIAVLVAMIDTMHEHALGQRADSLQDERRAGPDITLLAYNVCPKCGDDSKNWRDWISNEMRCVVCNYKLQAEEINNRLRAMGI